MSVTKPILLNYDDYDTKTKANKNKRIIPNEESHIKSENDTSIQNSSFELNFLFFWWKKEPKIFREIPQSWLKHELIKDNLKNWLVNGSSLSSIANSLDSDASYETSKLFIHLILRAFNVHSTSHCKSMSNQEFEKWLDKSKLQIFIDWFNKYLFKKIDETPHDNNEIKEESKSNSILTNKDSRILAYDIDQKKEDSEKYESNLIEEKEENLSWNFVKSDSIKKTPIFEKDKSIDVNEYVEKLSNPIFDHFVSNLTYDSFLLFFEHYLVDGWTLTDLDQRITSKILQNNKNISCAYIVLRLMGISTPTNSKYKSMFTYDEFLDFLKNNKDDLFEAFKQIKLRSIKKNI